MLVLDSADAAQSEGEGPDGSDKPPLDGSTLHTYPHPNSFVNGTTYHSTSHMQPHKVVKAAIGSTPRPATPSAMDSPSPSDSESWSAPSTRPPSQAASRAPSLSGGVSGNKLTVPHMSNTAQKGKPLPSEKPLSTPTSRSRTPSTANLDGGQKFTLKDLITSAPKLSRKSSARSTSSKKSDSDVERKSVGGDSAASLTQKYGVCQKVAIGKGATSVVRLAHKWDRSEEKLYAVKEFRKRRKNESEKEYVKKLTAEFCISSTLHHINIVETVDLVQDENQHWCEVMEFCPGGDLYCCHQEGWYCCFKQMLSGVSYLHSQGVAHRDIKPENLFFDTKAYDARLVDIWACGIVYYCLHFQEMPWRAAQMSDTLYVAYVAACAVQHKDKDKDKDVVFPPTINNLSPRACR
ncbi:Pkinase-domain-containing protein [Suillus cothurnatus]|nr:Pkinase-domain-containing protein [Suillus cothurnatus]